MTEHDVKAIFAEPPKNMLPRLPRVSTILNLAEKDRDRFVDELDTANQTVAQLKVSYILSQGREQIIAMSSRITYVTLYGQSVVYLDDIYIHQ